MASYQKEIDRIGTIQIQKAAGKIDYFDTIWIDTMSKHHDKYRIVKRIGCWVYLRWDALGAYPPRGLSQKYTVGAFLKRFKSVRS